MSDTSRSVRAGVIGATGYGGAELVRLLLGHPNVSLDFVSSETYAGQPLADALPHLRGFTGLMVQNSDPCVAAEGRDVLFVAWQHGRAMTVVADLLDAGVKVIDLSADFRLKSPDLYRETYGIEHRSPELLREAAYGLPELWGAEIRSARIVACPGCYPTGALLGLAPLVSERRIDTSDLIVNAVSGVSGAGRSRFELGLHFPEMDENCRPYSVTAHRHRPEMEQQIAALGGGDPRVVFVPHLVPMVRGELCTMYARLTAPLSPSDAQTLYESFYAGLPFVQVLPYGRYPATKNVAGTNMCHLGIAIEERSGRATVMAAVDNLVRGTAGQAVQSMNLMFGLPETAGLMLPGQYP